jgi:hypothetical protein
MAEKSIFSSPYIFCEDNPVKFIDPNGMQKVKKGPTPAEAAAMSALVYDDLSDKILRGGWRVSNRKIPNTEFNNFENGLKSALYERTKSNGTIEYCYATAGTKSMEDVKQDALQPFGLSSQYVQARQNAININKEVGNADLTFTGHSLGGGEAAVNAYSTGRSAITFNPAGVTILTEIPNLHTKIDAYIMTTDPLNNIQNIAYLLVGANGTIHRVRPMDFASVYNGHSMDNMLKSFGINPNDYPKPKPNPDPFTTYGIQTPYTNKTAQDFFNAISHH